MDDDEEITTLQRRRNTTTTSNRNNEHLVLGNRYELELRNFVLSDDEEDEELGWFVARLPVSTTLTELVVSFLDFERVDQNNHRLVEPLCQCLSTLRSQNEHHPLRKLELRHVVHEADSGEILHALHLFLIAAKEFGIIHLKFQGVLDTPIECLLEFCHDNSHLKVLEMERVFFTDGNAAISLPRDNDSSTTSMLALDKLILDNVDFTTTTAETKFKHFIAHATYSALTLNPIRNPIRNSIRDSDYSSAKISYGIVSELMKPSVEQLVLLFRCRLHDFQAALDAGKTSLIELDFTIYGGDYDETVRKINLVIQFIREAAKLKRLVIYVNPLSSLPSTLLRQFVEAFEACATVTHIEVNRGPPRDPSDREVVQQLRRITARNRTLERFVANPTTYPTDRLLDLMRRFNHSPTGRYLLARHLPELFTFQKGHCLFPPLKSRGKKAPIPKPTRELRKRKNI